MAENEDSEFQSRVAFDTFDNRYATDYTLTLRSTHKEYTYSRSGRTILCAADDNKHSETAVEWMLEELAENDDEIICVRVIDPNAKISSQDSSLEEKQYRDEASRFLNNVLSKNIHSKRIQIYEPAILVVGTRGKSMDGFKGLLPGSVSKYCLQHSPVPVVVVRPSQKREKKKAKREADPTRRHYRDVLSVEDDEDLKIYDKGATTDSKIIPRLPHYLQLDNSSKTSVDEKNS